MRTKNTWNILIIFVFACFWQTNGSEFDTLFPVPDIIKGNVAFWKKIYTEVSLKEGLIHDRDYPLVIFEKLTNDPSAAVIKTQKEKIVSSLTIITSQPQTAWSQKEKDIFNLYKTHADTSVIAGAVDRVRFQQGQMERYRAGLTRSGMFIDTIRAIFKHYGVPQRLAYLPHVESSFNTEAYSKVGAAGLWQFMRGTAKLFGMKVDYTIDERRDPIQSTIAAAKYLSSSYNELKSWPLAITSYNHGIYGMKRAVAQTGSRDIGEIIKKYDSRSFKFASSNFYGCFLAASEIAENYQKYFPTVTLAPPMKFVGLTLSHYIEPDVICKYINIPREKFTELNPAIRPAVFEQNKKLPKGFTIHIPADIPLESAKLALVKIPDSLKSNEPDRLQYYKVNKGDNLATIASRLGVSINELAAENNITRHNLIRAGQILRVPPKPTSRSTKTQIASAKTPVKEIKQPVQLPSKPVEIAEADTSTIEAAVEIANAEAESAIPPEEAPGSSGTTGVTVVVPEELQSQISHEQNDTVKTLKSDTTTSQIVEAVEDSLKDIVLTPAISTQDQTTSPESIGNSEFDVSLYNLDAVLSPVGTSAEIIVSLDETIGHYADWLKLPTYRIRKLNDMGRTSDIRVGNKLLIPIDKKDALESFVAQRLEYHMAIEEDFYSQYKVTDTKSIQVK
ncbi:MAG: transglycosylase SLT domain-containing protein, partial [Fibrobacter sp.]|nr:transglycosylase SLT domain-containing protein [Fibrobacter sp.]